jgi:hypothetical protein
MIRNFNFLSSKFEKVFYNIGEELVVCLLTLFYWKKMEEN